jgi:redox-sensing transcriptional repressor
MKLPPRTIERLSKYRRLLSNNKYRGDDHIFSHKLAGFLNLTPEQVRRDLMLIGINGDHRKGYHVGKMIELIGSIIDKQEGHNLALVGIGNLGRAVLRFIRKSGTRMNIVAAFDTDMNKINTSVSGVPCYSIGELPAIIVSRNIDIAILTVPPEAVNDIKSRLIEAGIKGILNFTSVPLDVPEGVYLKDYDIITSLEEIGFYIKG